MNIFNFLINRWMDQELNYYGPMKYDFMVKHNLHMFAEKSIQFVRISHTTNDSYRNFDKRRFLLLAPHTTHPKALIDPSSAGRPGTAARRGSSSRASAVRRSLRVVFVLKRSS